MSFKHKLSFAFFFSLSFLFWRQTQDLIFYSVKLFFFFFLHGKNRKGWRRHEAQNIQIREPISSQNRHFIVANGSHSFPLQVDVTVLCGSVLQWKTNPKNTAFFFFLLNLPSSRNCLSGDMVPSGGKIRSCKCVFLFSWSTNIESSVLRFLLRMHR